MFPGRFPGTILCKDPTLSLYPTGPGKANLLQIEVSMEFHSQHIQFAWSLQGLESQRLLVNLPPRSHGATGPKITRNHVRGIDEGSINAAGAVAAPSPFSYRVKPDMTEVIVTLDMLAIPIPALRDRKSRTRATRPLLRDLRYRR